MSDIFINSNCISCGICVDTCPAHLFKKVNLEEYDENDGEEASERTKVTVPSTSGCIQCGHCVCLCPTEAIQHEKFPYSELKPVEKEKQVDWEAFHALIASRRSVRRYKKEAIPRETLTKIVQVAEMAPTACNSRTMHWTVVTKPELIRAIQKETIQFLQRGVTVLDTPWCGFLAKLFPKSEIGTNYARLPFLKAVLKESVSSDVVFFDAPAVLIVHHVADGGRFADTDAQLALQNATLAAGALGLGTFYTGFLTRAADNTPGIRKILGIPENHKIAGGMTVGVPAVNYRYLPVREYPDVTFLE